MQDELNGSSSIEKNAVKKVKNQSKTDYSTIAEEGSFGARQTLPAIDVASDEVGIRDSNNEHLVEGEVLNEIYNDKGCGKPAVPPNVMKSSKDENCNDIKTLYLGRCCEENPRNVFIINVPARSNFSNYSAQLNGCETLMASDPEISSSGSELFTLTFDDFAFRKEFLNEGKGHTRRIYQGKDENLTCRICHSGTTVDDHETLISPCLCTGSMKYVHESCLIYWLKRSVKTNCELCLHKLRVKKSLKPLGEWHLSDKKPALAVVWFLTLIIALTLMITVIMKDASRGCTTTLCIVFYVVGLVVVIFGVIFLRYWAIKSAVYLKRWLVFNQVWLLEEKYFSNVSYETVV